MSVDERMQRVLVYVYERMYGGSVGGGRVNGQAAGSSESRALTVHQHWARARLIRPDQRLHYT
jgi:hypothetical protein